MHYFHPLDEAFAFALGLFGFCCAKDCSVPTCPLVVRYCIFFFLLLRSIWFSLYRQILDPAK